MSSDPQQTEIEKAQNELSQAREQLVNVSRMAALGSLLASIIHEINTPVGSILSNNETMLRSVDTVQKAIAPIAAESKELSKANRLLEMMRGLGEVDKLACERIASVVRGLKTFARADDAKPRAADLHELIGNTLKLVGCEYRRRVNVVTRFGELPEIECYPQRLSQVLLNVLVNAGQAIEDEGTVTVTTALEDDRVRISIADTGHGIPPELMPKLFSGFTTKPMGVGTGLGLSISRQIIDKHGGSIEVESEVGSGTVFHILIPIAQAGTENPPKAAERKEPL